MNDAFQYIQERVQSLQPGQEVKVDGDLLKGNAPMPGWTRAGWVLEGISGSAYELSYRTDPMTRDIIFRREKEPVTGDLRTYVSPDRRRHFEQLPSGLYKVVR